MDLRPKRKVRGERVSLTCVLCKRPIVPGEPYEVVVYRLDWIEGRAVQTTLLAEHESCYLLFRKAHKTDKPSTYQDNFDWRSR